MSKGSNRREEDTRRVEQNLDRIKAKRGCRDLDRPTPCDKCNCWKKK